MSIRKKIVWTRYFGRKFCSQRFEIVTRVFTSDFFRQRFHVQLQNNLVVPERGNHTIYYYDPEWKVFTKKVFIGVCKNLKTFHLYMKLVKVRQIQYGKGAARLASGNLKMLSWSALKERYLAFDKLHMDFFNGPIWVPFITEPYISEVAEKVLNALLKRNKLEPELPEYFDVIFSPEEKNAVVSEHESLINLAIRIKRKQPGKGQIEKSLDAHYKRFKFLPCYDLNDKPWTREYFVFELKKLLKKDIGELTLELNQLRARYPFRRREFRRMIAQLHPDQRQKEWLVMAHEMSFVKDQRDDYRRLGSHNIQPLYHEMARRAGVTIKEITHLIKREMLEYLSTGKLPVSKSVLKSRVKGYILLRKFGGHLDIFNGPEMRKVLKREMGSRQVNEERLLPGIIGSRGKASGQVQVIYTKHDLRKIKPHDVMVAVTTHPDFVPAMRKACAIVTDEGGITCHAAIVARELAIPCVVGTKMATKILKDGDRVEVDAFKGIVKKV